MAMSRGDPLIITHLRCAWKRPRDPQEEGCTQYARSRVRGQRRRPRRPRNVLK